MIQSSLELKEDLIRPFDIISQTTWALMRRDALMSEVFCNISMWLMFQETEQMQRYNQRLIEELKNKQTQERARLPKIQRSEAKTRMAMFKKSLRINSLASPDQDREKIKQVINKNDLNGVNA